MQVFISYRRLDTGGTASRLAEAIRSKLPQATIFLDTEAPTPGPFPTRIARALRAADVMLALIGNRWLGDNVEPRVGVDSVDDWVCREITAALETGVTVIPILVDKAPLPQRHQLPPLMRGLVDQEAAPLRTEERNRDWNSDVDDIVRQIRITAPAESPQQAEHAPYILAMYSALVRWIIYEAELSWRVTSALIPVLTVLAGIGALPSVLEHASRGMWIAALVASCLGLLIGILWRSMVERTRLFFKYRVDSANVIEKSFPVPKERAHLFRTEFFRGHAKLVDAQSDGTLNYEFSFLQRITMGDAMKIITSSYILLLSLLTVLNIVQVIRAF